MRIARIVSTVAALIALGIGIYLTYLHYNHEVPPCLAGGGGGCETVQTSRYAVQFGVPVSLFGVIGSAAMLVLIWLPMPIARALTVVLAAIGVLFSGYLTYLELWVIHAICQWCVASAVMWVVLLASEGYRLSGALATLDDDGAADA